MESHPCSWIGRLNIVKMSIPFPKSIHRLNTIPIKILAAFFAGIDKPILKYENAKGPEQPKQYWGKKKKEQS